MKKTYIKPAVSCIKINAESIIALSTVKGDENTITSENKNDFEMYGREDNSSTSNIWDNVW